MAAKIETKGSSCPRDPDAIHPRRVRRHPLKTLIKKTTDLPPGLVGYLPSAIQSRGWGAMDYLGHDLPATDLTSKQPTALDV